MEQMSLFDAMPGSGNMTVPLASRLRPQKFEDFIGQEHLLGPGKMLRHLIEKDQISSMIFWGPPGVGKTTLAGIIAERTKADFINFSAVTSGIREIKDVMNQAEAGRKMGKRTVLFVDEIHRFNKAQQDAFLPYVEKGSILLIGATTENPSFEVNAALLSRCRVFVLKALEEAELLRLLQNALLNPAGFAGQRIEISGEQLRAIAIFADGDARMALNTLEMVVLNGEITTDGCIRIADEGLAQCLDKKSLLYDKAGEEHYNLISALHKSMRNSDPDAAIYWMCRMLEGGENPLYIARRLIRFASEDIGIADSNALTVAVAAYQACHFLGMPECDVHLTHAVTYLAMAAKSNAMYRACENCKEDIRNRTAEPVPLILRNAPTKLMEDLHYGKGYRYAHDTEEKLTDMECMPDSMRGVRYYYPTEQGDEAEVGKKLQEILIWKQTHRKFED